MPEITYHQQLLFPEYENNDPSISMRDPYWRNRAQAALRLVAEKKLYFTTDDIWKTLDVRPQEPRKLGPIVFNAWVQRLIQRTEITTNSMRLVCHGRPVRVWKSLIWKGDDDVDDGAKSDAG